MTKRKPELIEAVPVVTEAHGKVFANEWLEVSCDCLDMDDAFSATGILTFPFDGDQTMRAAYTDIADEIIRDTLAVVKEQVADAFVAVANNVFARERRRPVLTPG